MSETLSMTTSNKSVGESIQEIVPAEPSLIDWKEISKPLAWIVGGFLLFFFLPVDSGRFTGSVICATSLIMAQNRI